LSDYELLELLLFRALPRHDVKPLAIGEGASKPASAPTAADPIATIASGSAILTSP
jgi:hypothetical protein